jgi:hypothetical protein
MKTSIVFLSLILFALASCTKEKPQANGPQINLSATTFYKDGSEETRRDRSGAFARSSYSRLITENGSNKFLVNLGATGSGSALPVFGVSFILNGKTTAQAVNRTYRFPADYAAVSVLLRNEVAATMTESLFFPTRGTVSFAYDSIAKKINGAVQNLEFSIIPNDPFNRYRITLQGTFAGVPVN